jgi:hypothetical protein
VGLAKQSPDGSVLKYALKSLLRQTIEDNAQVDILHFALQLCYHNPILIPLLKSILAQIGDDEFQEIAPQLQELVVQNAIFHRSDGMVWALNFLGSHKIGLEDKVVDEVIKTQDSLPLLMIYTFGDDNQKAKVVQIATEIINAGDNFEMDQHWMLLYQIFHDGKIKTPYPDEDSFEILKDSGVSFIKIDETQDRQ